MSKNNNAKEFQDSNNAKMSILDRTAEYSEGIYVVKLLVIVSL